MTVDLPPPEAPTSAQTEPASTLKLMPSSTTFSRIWYRKVTFSKPTDHVSTAPSACAPPDEPMSGSRSTSDNTRSAAPAARVNALSMLLSACVIVPQCSRHNARCPELRRAWYELLIMFQ